jgi:hypothetical protein
MNSGAPIASRLLVLLQPYAPVAGNAGGRPPDRATLRAGLNDLMRHYRLMLWLAVGLATAVFVGEAGVAIAYVDKPGVLKAIGAAAGVTVAGSIETIRRLARDLAQTNLVVVLCGELDSESLRPVLAALVRRMNAR